MARRPAALALALAAGLAAVALAAWAFGSGGAQRNPGVAASQSLAAASPTPTATPTPRPTPPRAPRPTPRYLTAATNGVRLPLSQRERATRQPIVVMVDDHPAARPQSGISQAEVVYHALAEGGIPRYMLVFQVNDASVIGPVRSTRLYFLDWATEWRPLYAHVGGAPNAMQRLRAINGRLAWDADEHRWGGRYFWRIRARRAPHNTYASTTALRGLARRLGSRARFDRSPWTFIPETPLAKRPGSGGLVVAYRHNVVTYRYDRRTNRYLRGVTGARLQRDLATRRVVAPANVVVLFTQTAPLRDSPGAGDNEKKLRIDIRTVGTGRALVMRNGEVIAARWSKASATAPTRLTYASGCRAGQPVGLVPGQIFIQVVPASMRLSPTGRVPREDSCPR
ncbi:MAG: DUF3048 domain-containing protein [Chloroflexota bacterium]|nr:DUF3048 domain-containing protein [Chloroflexota bacterium]